MGPSAIEINQLRSWMSDQSSCDLYTELELLKRDCQCASWTTSLCTYTTWLAVRHENNSEQYTYHQAENSNYDRQKVERRPFPKAFRTETHRTLRSPMLANHS
jgi:hypothetical protein